MPGLIVVDTIILTPALAGDPGHDFTVFDAYVQNGVTELPLIYHEGDGNSATRIKPLRPVRQDVGNDPWETRPESGDIFSQGDFSHGSGQTNYHTPTRDLKEYLYSEGYDVLTTPGKITHLKVCASSRAITGTGKMAMALDLPFIADGVQVWKGNAGVSAWVSENPYVAEPQDTAVNDLTSSGDELFAALGGRGIHKRNNVGTWSHYSDVSATRVAWVKDRLMAADGANIYFIDPSTVPTAPTPLLTLPTGWAFQQIFEAGAFIYAVATDSLEGRSTVYVFGLQNGNIVEITRVPAPNDQVFYCGLGYLGQLFLGGGVRNKSLGYDPVLYEALTDASGGLSFVKLVQGNSAGSTNLSIRTLEPMGEKLAFGWSLGSSYTYGARTGIALYHLGTGAIVNHFKKESGTGVRINDILAYKGRVLFAVNGDAVYVDDLNLFVPSAVLITSVADWNNAGQKIWDKVEISTKPMPPGTSIQVDYTKSLPEDAQWVAAFTYNVPGSSGEYTRLGNIKSRQFALRFTSAARTDQTLAPEVISFQVRSNPAPVVPEYELIRTVRILAQDQKDRYAEPVYCDPDDLRAQLLSQVYQWVTFSEAGLTWDARITGVSSVSPAEALLFSTGGDTGRKAYFLQVAMDATRSS